MDIEKNTTYTCRVVRINGEEVDYLAALAVDDECITRITIKEWRNIYAEVSAVRGKKDLQNFHIQTAA